MATGKKLLVVGGGAAGFFCAVNAARLNPPLQVTILEKSGKLLSKVRISGGGRCNVTHACFDIGEMSRRYPRGSQFVKKAFHHFFTKDTINWFRERGVELKTEPDGRMFPDTDSSQTIIDCLIAEANRYGVQVMMQAEVKGLEYANDSFRIALSGDRQLDADFICIACGGYPKSSMFDWLKDTGHTIEEPVPSLFTFNMPGNSITQLMGVSVNGARVKIAGTRLSEEGPLLITHWGMSGPVILKLSAAGAYELAQMNYDFSARINWMAGHGFHENNLREKWSTFRNSYSSKKLVNMNVSELPGRLWEYLLEQSGIPRDMRFADLNTRTENTLIKNLVDFTVNVKGKTTFKEEFVTAGGIRLNEIDHNTMESKKLKGLYFAGEVMNVDGITGGYNFQHAWTSGFVAAKGIAGE